MKTKRFDFNWKPLQLAVTFSVDGSVPDAQNYNADSGEYTPDYTLTPLAIQPRVSIIDKDEVLPAGSVNHLLANIRWYQIINGTRTLILSDSSDYEIVTSGGNAGRIRVKKNAAPEVPITLEFYAEYSDTRNGQLLVIRGSYQITCSNASDIVRVELNAEGQTIYNPLSDPDTQTVTATVYLGQGICPAERIQLVWEKLYDDGSWHPVGYDEVIDYDVTASGSTCTVNRRLMGAECYIRCRVKYSAEGTPGSVALTAASPQAMAAFVRRIPKFEYDITGVPVNIPAGLLVIAPEAIIRTTNGEIANAERELLPLWYIATNKATGSLSYTLVGHGIAPTIPTKAMDNLYGAVLGLDVVDRGYIGAVADASGTVFIDNADGKVIVMH